MELWHYYSQNYSYIWEEFYQHFLMSAYGVFFAALVAIPVGIFIARHAHLSQWVFSLTNIIQTIPALAMLAVRSEEHTSELQSRGHLVCCLLLVKKKIFINIYEYIIILCICHDMTVPYLYLNISVLYSHDSSSN